MGGFLNGMLVLDENVFVTSSGNNNDVPVTSSLLYASTTNNNDAITGLDAGGRGNGFFLLIANINASNTLVIKNNSSASAAANRIITITGADVTLAPYKTAMLGYDSTNMQWHLIEVLSATAPTATNAVTRPINSTTYTISATKEAEVDYYISITCTASIGSAASGTVEFQYSTNGGSTWVPYGKVTNSNTVSVAVALNSVVTQVCVIHATGIPANALCRMVTTSSGTTSISYVYGWERY